MACFHVSDTWKHVLLAERAETAEVVAQASNIDENTAFLVHFGRILGDLYVDFDLFSM